MGIMRVFASYRLLEDQVAELKKERELLLNRLLHSYSGYGLDQRVPSYYEAQRGGTDEPVSTRKSPIDLLQELESASVELDTGITGDTVSAARQRAQEENEKAAKEYEDNIIRARKMAAAQAGHDEVS